MKRKFLNKLAAFSLISSTLIAAVPEKASAAWINNYYGGWAYNDGYQLATGWKWINGIWYYFDSMGRMQTGWLNDGGKMYYLDSSGAMQTGVIQIEGKVYLFSESGDMQVGFAVVDGKQYNFADNGACIGTDMPTPKRAFDYYGIDTMPLIPSQIMNPNSEISSEIPYDGSEPVVEYKITYKDDDGTILSVRRINADDKIRLYEPSKSGYKFIEWNTDEDGDGKSYYADDKITLTKNMTLYAQWDEIEDKAEDDEEDVEVTAISIKVAGKNDPGTTTISVGQKYQLSAVVTPSNATNRKVKWAVKTTSTGGQATISSNGMITPTSPGYITVTATALDGSGVSAEKKILIE